MTEVIGSNRAGGALNSASAGGSYPTSLGGFGVRCGDAESTIARNMVARNGGRFYNSNGKSGDIIYVPPWQELIVASGRIDGKLSTAQQLTMLAGMQECEVTKFIFRRFSATPAAGFQGGIYCAEPVDGVNQAGALLLADTNTYATGYGAAGLTTVRKDATPELRTFNGMWWCPKTPSAVDLSFDVIAFGIPTWLQDFIVLNTGQS